MFALTLDISSLAYACVYVSVEYDVCEAVSSRDGLVAACKAGDRGSSGGSQPGLPASQCCSEGSLFPGKPAAQQMALVLIMRSGCI